MKEENLENAALQRAALMGLMCSILKQDNVSLKQVQNAIISCFSDLIDRDLMVGDVVDLYVAEACKEHLEQERALQDVRDILGGDL